MVRDAWRRRTAGISDLDTSLADVDRDDFTHDLRGIDWKGSKSERVDAKRRVEKILTGERVVAENRDGPRVKNEEHMLII